MLSNVIIGHQSQCGYLVATAVITNTSPEPYIASYEYEYSRARVYVAAKDQLLGRNESCIV